jgi:hypothetical protein
MAAPSWTGQLDSRALQIGRPRQSSDDIELRGESQAIRERHGCEDSVDFSCMQRQVHGADVERQAVFRLDEILEPDTRNLPSIHEDLQIDDLTRTEGSDQGRIELVAGGHALRPSRIVDLV